MAGNPDPRPAVQMRNITVRYGSVLANDRIDLTVRRGAFHALVGENGAGKSTLMHVLYGLARPEAGEVRVEGSLLPPGDPGASLDAGIGLVAQHPSLAPTLSAWENVVLGREPARRGLLHRRRARAQTAALADRLGVDLPLDAPVEALPFAVRQVVEIIKALYRQARILILDEPTSSLAPPEADRLFTLLHRLRDGGVTILLVTHRLREVQGHADRATVLRRGRCVRTFEREEIEPDALVRAIVGPRKGAALSLPAPGPAGPKQGRPGEVCLKIEGLTLSAGAHTPVHGLSLVLRRGEILGIAGVAGNGQRELVQAIAGQRPARAGRVLLNGRDLTRLSIAARRAAGLATIPEDRLAEGLIPAFSLQDNLILGEQRRFSGIRGMRLPAISARARALIDRYDIRASGPRQAAGSLSGGNQQKVVVARELARSPDLVLAVQPARGLDLAATAFVHGQLRSVRARGGAVLLVSADLEELMALSDRIAVIYRGRLAGEQLRGAYDTDALGRMMTGSTYYIDDKN